LSRQLLPGLLARRRPFHLGNHIHVKEKAMQTHHLRSRILVAAVIGLVALGGISVANAADGDQQYTGCLKNGTLSNVAIGTAPSARCPTGANQITWSEQGTQGEPGIQGEQGPQGEQGLAGAPGTVAQSQVWFVENYGGSLGSDDPIGHTVSMTLPAGSYVIEARAKLQNSGSFSQNVSVECRMPGGVRVFKFLNGQTNNPVWHGSQEIVELTTAINHAGGTLGVLSCYSGIDHTSVSNITVLATPVGSVLAG